eukprot:8689_1
MSQSQSHNEIKNPLIINVAIGEYAEHGKWSGYYQWPDLLCAVNDKFEMKQLWRKYEYKIFRTNVSDRLTKAEFCHYLNDAVIELVKDTNCYDSLIIVYSGHGGRDKLYFTDAKVSESQNMIYKDDNQSVGVMDVTDIMDYFADEKLKKMIKIQILDMCQGDKINENVNYGKGKPHPPKQNKNNNNYENWFIFTSNSVGHKSFFDAESKISYFLSAFITVMDCNIKNNKNIEELDIDIRIILEEKTKGGKAPTTQISNMSQHGKQIPLSKLYFVANNNTNPINTYNNNSNTSEIIALKNQKKEWEKEKAELIAENRQLQQQHNIRINKVINEKNECYNRLLYSENENNSLKKIHNLLVDHTLQDIVNVNSESAELKSTLEQVTNEKNQYAEQLNEFKSKLKQVTNELKKKEAEQENKMEEKINEKSNIYIENVDVIMNDDNCTSISNTVQQTTSNIRNKQTNKPRSCRHIDGGVYNIDNTQMDCDDNDGTNNIFIDEHNNNIIEETISGENIITNNDISQNERQLNSSHNSDLEKIKHLEENQCEGQLNICIENENQSMNNVQKSVDIIMNGDNNNCNTQMDCDTNNILIDEEEPPLRNIDSSDSEMICNNSEFENNTQMEMDSNNDGVLIDNSLCVITNRHNNKKRRLRSKKINYLLPETNIDNEVHSNNILQQNNERILHINHNTDNRCMKEDENEIENINYDTEQPKKKRRLNDDINICNTTTISPPSNSSVIEETHTKPRKSARIAARDQQRKAMTDNDAKRKHIKKSKYKNKKQINNNKMNCEKKNNGNSSKATTNSNKYKRKKPKKKLNTPMILSDDDGTINNNKLKSSARIAKISNRNSKSSKKKTVIRNKSKNTKKDNGNPNDNNNFQNSYYESINCHLCDKHFDEIDEYTAHLKNFKHYGKFLHYFKNKWNEQDRINALDWIKGDILTTFVQAHLIDNQNNWSEIKFVKQHAQSLNIKACKNKTDLRKCPTNTNFTYSRHIHLLITCMDHGEDDDNELAKTIYDHMIICRTNKLTGHWIYPQDKNTFRKYFKHNVQGSSNSMQKCHCLR